MDINNYRSERPFSIMLAEELLRIAIEKDYKRRISFFQTDIKATPVRKVNFDDETITDLELNAEPFSKIKQRQVMINAIISPLDLSKPYNLNRVEAKLRLFSFETKVSNWQPHYLQFNLLDNTGKVLLTYSYIFENGIRDSVRLKKNKNNYCAKMCELQVCTREPELHRIHWKNKSF